MRLLLSTVALLAVGCSDDPGGGPAIDSHVQYYEWPGTIAPRIDILIVVENTSAMTAHQSALAMIAPAADTAFFGSGGAFPDVRFAATTADGTGTLRQPSTTTDTFLALPYDAHYDRSTNFTGSVTDALGQLMNVGTSGTGAVQPIASAKAALDANPMFIRDEGLLGIVLLTAGEDTSAGAVTDLANGFKARKTDPSQTMLSGGHDLPAARLESFYDQFPNRNVVVDLASTEIASAVSVFESIFLRTLGLPCYVEPADVDAATPGNQYECDLRAYYADDSSEAIRQCTAGSTDRCFELVTNVLCADPDLAELRFKNFPSPYTPPVRGQCVVTGQN